MWWSSTKCLIPDDFIDSERYPLLMAREAMRQLSLGAGGRLRYVAHRHAGRVAAARGLKDLQVRAASSQRNAPPVGLEPLREGLHAGV